jgi:uncharacterized protein with GYD domain
MVRYIALFNFTEQGIRKFADSTSRAQAFTKDAQKSGVKVISQFWTVGAFDGVLILEAPDEQTATAVLLKLGGLGNVRTRTLRAYDRAEMAAIVASQR